MKLMSKSILLTSIVGVSLYGVQQLRQSDLDPQQKATGTHIKSTSNNPAKTKEDKQVALVNKQTKTLLKPELMVSSDWESDFEQEGQGTTEPHNQGDSKVSFEDGLLTVIADNAALADILVQIASEANMPINSETIDPEQRITLSIQKTPIDRALRELLSGYDYFFLYGANKARLQATWIYSAGTGQTIALIDHDNSSKELTEDDLYSPYPISRALALQRYVGSDTPESMQHIRDAVQDDDPDVRATAILTAEESAVELSITTLKELAESDPSPIVRSVALNTLSMNSELSSTQIAELAEMALDDTDESIREEAEAILEGLAELDNKELEAPASQQSWDEIET